MKAWENAMHNGDSSELENILSDDFVWENIAMDSSSSKAETIQFATGIKKEVPSFQIENYKSLHEGMVCWLVRIACIRMEEMKLLLYV